MARIKMKRCAFVLYMVLAYQTTQAAEIPRYNPDRFCDHVQVLSRDSDHGAAARHVCIDREQEAYEYLKDRWDSFSSSEQEEGLAMIRGNAAGYPGGSYASLADYLDALMRRDESIQEGIQRKQTNHFRFD